MSQTGPWSVKGIDSRAREAAREAAREEGTTLGAYLNRLILQDDPAATSPAGNAQSASYAPHDPIGDVTDRPSQTYAAQSPRRAPPADEPSNAALDRLTRRIESAEARSTLAITGIDQSVVGLLSRLENAEHNQQALGNHWDNVLGDVQKTYDVLTSKISAIENNDASARNQAALQALEEALGKLASHVYEENELVSEESSAIKMRIETGLGELTERMDAVDESVEKRLHEASETVTKAVADSQMRVEGTNRHLAERFSQLEMNIQNELTAANEQSEAFGTSLAGNQAQLGTIQDRLNRAEASTNEALKHLKSTFSSLDARLEGISEGTNANIANVADDIRKQFDAKFDSLADDMRAMIATTRAEMASEIEVAARSVDDELIARLEDTISAMGARLDASEDLQAQTMEMVGDTVTRITESVDQRLIAGQNQQNRDIEQISAQVTRVSESIEQRLGDIGSDEFSTAATSELREDMVRFTNSIDARFEQLEERDTSSIDRISSEVEQLADKLNERVQESEQRSANAIEQVGEQVANVADRLEHKQAQALQEFSQKLDARTQSQEARLSSALSNVSDRLERIQEQSITTISPVQKAIAALAQRIEAIEEFSAPPYIERDGTPDVPPMVSPVKIDTTIEDATQPFDITGALTASATVAAASTSAAIETKPEPETDAEPFEAGYKNWSESSNDLPPDLLDEQEQQEATAGTSEKVHDYFAELPPPEETDEAIFDASNEARDSDIFEDDPVQISDVAAEKVDAFDATANPYSEDFAPAPTSASGDDFLAQARNAAVSAAAAKTATQRPSKSRPQKVEKKSGSNVPVIAAGIGLLAVAGTASFMWLNKDSGPEAVNLADARPTAPTNTPAAAALPAATPNEAPNSLAALNAQINSDDLVGDASIPSDVDTAAAEATSSETPAPTPISLNVPPPIEVEASPAKPEQPTQLSALTVPTIARIASISDAANGGNAIAQYQLGTSKISAGDISSGVALIRSAEAQGLAVAQYELANLHIRGTGVEKDPARAIPLFKAAAQAGHVGAMHNYATLIANTPGREAEAANWYQRAAELGLVEAQFNIATMYESGIGVSPSLHRALYWYELAAANGDADAAVAVSEIANSGEVSSIATSQIKQEVGAWTASPKNAIANGQFSAQPWTAITRSQILGVQKALNALDYNAGPADGAMGATTRAAIKSFQSDTGQAITGIISNDLIDALNDAAKRARG